MLELLKSHTSVREYTDEKIPNDVLHDLLRTGQHAASSHFVQAYSVIHVTDAHKKEKLKELSRNHIQIDTAPVTLVFCADLKRLEISSTKLHDMPFEGGTAENLIVPIVDTAIFAQNFVVAAESKGYGICYIGGVRNDIAAVSEVLELPEYVVPLFAMTVGVPAKKNEVKPRLPLAAILHENTYDDSEYEQQLRAYDDTMEEYYQVRSSNQKDSQWTDVMARFFRRPRREHMKEFLEGKGFFKK